MRHRSRLVAFVLLLVVLVATALPHAQKVWDDRRHEVTVRNAPGAFACTVVNSTATTLTALAGSCVAPGVGQSLYITDVAASASAAATTTADQYLELKSGTGGACGTGTAVVWAAFNVANGSVIDNMQTPIEVASNSELCWMDAVAGNKTIVVRGYIGAS